MNIVYDYQALRMQRYGGVSRYFYEIIKRLRENKSLDIKLPVVCADNYYFRDMLFYFNELPFGSYFLNPLLMKALMLFYNNKIDILHPTYYDVKYLSDKELQNRKYKLIITVHDMIHEILIKEDVDTINKKRRMIEAADGIITVSECTKKDLLQFYPELDENKIKVIYHGSSVKIPNKLNVNIQLPKRYILYVGVRTGYKNSEILFRAMSRIGKYKKDIMLICAGGGEFTEDEKRLIEELEIAEQVKQYNMTDDELYMAYKKAQCFVFPSKYEGFGIPILEAFANECPVVLSESSCFPEIAEDAALYFKEDIVEDLENKIVQVLDNGSLRMQLKEKGKKRLKFFSWDKATKETLEFYQQILER